MIKTCINIVNFRVCHKQVPMSDLVVSVLMLISCWDYALYDDHECQLGGLNKYLIQATTTIKFSHLLLALQGQVA